MISKALARYIRISPKKMQPVARVVRGKRVSTALFTLANLNKRGARILRSVIESAFSNAKHRPENKYSDEDLYITRLTVDQGPTLKRYRAMSMGRAGMIRKKTSHILVELEAVPGAKADKKASKRAPAKKKPVIKGA